MTKPKDTTTPRVEERKGEGTTVAMFPIATVVEISIIGVFPAAAYPTLQTVVEDAVRELSARFEVAGGRDPHNRWSEVRPATKEEVLHFTPRKLHFTEDGTSHVCDTAHVARRNLTTNREEVTCKLCRRKLGISGD
jgi:hypothetical protein